MRSTLTLMLALLVGGLFAAPAGAAEPLRINSGLAAEMGLVRFEIVGGRLWGDSSEINRSSNSSARVGERQETLSINVDNFVPSLSYSLVEPAMHVQIDVVRGEGFTLACHHSGENAGADITFEQVPGAPLVLKTGGGNDARQRKYASVWALWLAEPELCRRELMPLLWMIRTEWRLGETAMQVEDALFQYASSTHDDPRARWTELVAQLADERFTARQQADYELRQFGTTVVPFLERIDPAKLDAEQRFRIRRIVGELSAAVLEDQPDAVVYWLSADPMVWASLLNRDDVERRRLALAQLEKVTGGKIAFNPEGAAEERAALAAQIKAALEPGGTP